MKLPLLLLLLVTIMAHAGSAFPAERRGKHASWDEVNVVAHGLLQLGQGLKEHVDKVKAQMRDVNAKMKTFNATLGELLRRGQEPEQSRGNGAEEEERRLRAAVEQEMKSDQEMIRSRMERLEQKVDKVYREESNFSEGAGAASVQRLVDAQNRRIDELVEKIRQQQDKLEKQSLHLQDLQSKKRVKSHLRRHGEATLRAGAEPVEGATDAVARDCHQLFLRGERLSGVYSIQPDEAPPLSVFCEMTSEGGWTLIQRRQDGSQDFNQRWGAYQSGFGSLSGEFWLGLENIRSISKQGPYLLQVEVSDWSGQQHSARYRFRLDGEEQKYAVHLEQVSSSGDLREVLSTGASGLPFSTSDRDNDLDADVNCAELLSGGWWFSGCGESNLNGKYSRRPSLMRTQQPRRHNRMFWTTMAGLNVPLRTTVMKIAPATIQQ